MTIKLGHELLYLSAHDVEACGLATAEVEAAIEAMFEAKARGSASMKPKLSLPAPAGALFLGSPGALCDPPLAGIKWVGVGDNQARGLPHIMGTILLSDGATGMPVAVIDAAWITGVRTAAITAVAAKRLARPDSATIAFIACGLQARTHLAALRPHFPLKRMIAYSRRRSIADVFAQDVEASGLETSVTEDPREAVQAADIVVTTTPVVPRTPPFLDAGWLRPGAFAAMVDLGFSWHPEPLRALDLVVTDDLSQAGSEHLVYPEPYAGEIADLVAGALAGRQHGQQRTALVFAGIGLADVAVAAAIYQRALTREIGRILAI